MTTMKHTTKQIRRNCKGQSMVEFGLTAPIFVLMVFGTIQMIGLTYQANATSKAMWDATRGGVVATSDNSALISRRMQKELEHTMAAAGLKNILLNKGNMTQLIEQQGDMRVGNLNSKPHFLYMGLKWLGEYGVGAKGAAFANFEGKLPPRNHYSSDDPVAAEGTRGHDPRRETGGE